MTVRYFESEHDRQVCALEYDEAMEKTAYRHPADPMPSDRLIAVGIWAEKWGAAIRADLKRINPA